MKSVTIKHCISEREALISLSELRIIYYSHDKG